MAEMKPVQTHVLKAFRILEVDDKPHLAAIGLQTMSGGRHRFLATRHSIMKLAESLQEHSSKMPPEDDLSKP